MERELWKIISRQITRLDRRLSKGDYKHSVGRIVRVYLWAVLHDRPVYWACDRRNWAGVRPPATLPDQSTMSRRLYYSDTQNMLDQLMENLDESHQSSLVHYLDGKPLPVSRHSADQQAAFGRGAGGMERGYKLHAVYGEGNRPVAWSITPLNQCEHRVALDLIDEHLGPGYLLADANYDVNCLYEHAGQHGVTLLANRRHPRAKGLGHHRHSDYRRDAIARLESPSPFVRDLLQGRRRIETRFAHLTNFGGGLTCLPPWVRGPHRVRCWVAGKIIVRLARDQHLKAEAA